MNEIEQKKQIEERTRTSVLQQLALLETLSLEQLREKWRALYGSKAPGYKKKFLVRQLAYRIQELAYGGLSEKAKAFLKKAAANDPMANVLRKRPKKSKDAERILPGTRFVRVWNGKKYEVIAREKGFEYEGYIYRSLSAVASRITGAHWNGKVFFGVKGRSVTGERR